MGKITNENALTAMCVWEEMLTIFSDKNESNAYTDQKAKIGACSMRELVLHIITPAVEKAYAAVSDKYSESFDWEFIPAFLQIAEPVYAKSGFTMSEATAIEIGQQILEKLGEINE